MSQTIDTVDADVAAAAGGKPRERAVRAGRTRRAGQRPNWLGGAGAWIWLAIIVIPIYYIVITSVRPQAGFFSSNQLIPPLAPTLDGYALVLQSDFFLYLANSVIITVVSVVVVVFVCIMAAYAIVRSQTRFTRASFSFLLLGLAIPVPATIIPLFYMLSKAGLYDSLAALILPSIGFAVPVTVLILSNFIRDIPKELFESMKVDGSSDWRTLFSLVLPLARPAIVTVGLYNALNVWNGFLFPLVLTQSPDKRVLPLSLWTFQGSFSVNVPAVLAAVVLSTLPIFILYIFGRRQLIAGMTAGFSK
ncbi:MULTISPECIES: carbohydrate ABC transporter permease [unclassified Leifsonia]|uniref:carbohydrate ABC transporter permease n=1 Tax=unclassified Leifsonia TaxID=2663824 RepID=UPI0008A77B54|nr:MULTISPECIES: carbohydrate ABC transporter permease [unclassified Leifsonia]SEH99278.1 carbohydrate ABC transporter membrane protein 2, CUT1 family [Leifsonia sp. CL154]SFL68427.1 carbohydrate ABC transporter membrane protein 2, CUT1 family [Leifsonia sp. CL147]